jgi:hypothetical protein
MVGMCYFFLFFGEKGAYPQYCPPPKNRPLSKDFPGAALYSHFRYKYQIDTGRTLHLIIFSTVIHSI